MRLAWLTDIHLDFVDDAKIAGLGRELSERGADGAIVTGDIATANTLRPKLERFAEAAGGKPIYFVLGNHDFYGGSIDAVRIEAAKLERPLAWLPSRAPIAIGEETWLLGVDGWGDARLGRPETSSVVLSDFFLISDLRNPGARGLLERLRELGDEEASTLELLLEQVPARARTLVVATHVPPFRESCWHEGRISDDDWLPFFTCDAVGRALKSWASLHTTEVIVLCGHTHGAGVVRVLPNLEVRTGGADYGAPAIAGIIDAQ